MPSAAALDPVLRDSALAEAWISLPTLPLDCGSLQTLAHRTSNQRLLILRDGAGRPLRTIALNAPIGFVQSDPPNATLVAVRTLDTREVVAYRWQRRAGRPGQTFKGGRHDE